MAQHSIFTGLNRYPHIFRTARSLIETTHGADLGGGRLRILSFGCSTGEEMVTLRMYFPDARIYGCDINDQALQAAAARHMLHRGTVFRSRDESLAAFGPFDLVFAMSVLCLYPDSKQMQRLDHGFTFSKFCDLTRSIHHNLNPKGVVCIYNSNFSFSDLDFAQDYSPIMTPEIADVGFVEQFQPDGSKRTLAHEHEAYHAHRFVGSAGADPLLRNCLFLKDGGAATGVPFNPDKDFPQPNAFNSDGNTEILGMPPDMARAGRWIAAHSVVDHGTDENGDAWRRQQYFKSDMNSEMHSLGTVWRRAEPHSKVMDEKASRFIYRSTKRASTISRLRRAISKGFAG